MLRPLHLQKSGCYYKLSPRTRLKRISKKTVFVLYLGLCFKGKAFWARQSDIVP
jgi:hypothetical protein